MPGWFNKPEWRDSPAYMTFLKAFLYPITSESFQGKDYWTSALGQDPIRAIQDLVKGGALEETMLSLTDQLNESFKVPELKAMLKARGLKSSGAKNDLIRQLIDNDSDGMTKAVHDPQTDRTFDAHRKRKA